MLVGALLLLAQRIEDLALRYDAVASALRNPGGEVSGHLVAHVLGQRFFGSHVLNFEDRNDRRPLGRDAGSGEEEEEEDGCHERSENKVRASEDGAAQSHCSPLACDAATSRCINGVIVPPDSSEPEEEKRKRAPAVKPERIEATSEMSAIRFNWPIRS